MILIAGSAFAPRVLSLATSLALGLAISTSIAVADGARPVDPLDWPAWRGPAQNSTSAETQLVDKWNPKGGASGNLLWKRSDLGTRSTPIVMNGKLYVLCRDKPGSATEGEKVVCVDAATGEQLWAYRFNVYLTDVPDTRVAWSSVVGDPETGRIYAQGVSGYFCCLEGDTGKKVWDRSLHEEMGVITTYGGRTNVPVVFEDVVLISAVVVGWGGDSPEYDVMAKPSHRFMAFNKSNGQLRWMSGTSISPPDTTYSTPSIKVINGEAQLIFGGSDGRVWSFQPRTGKPLWNFPFSLHGLNVSPLVEGDMVYMAHALENMTGTTKGAVVAIDAKLRGDLAGKEKWLTYNIAASRSSPVMVDGKLWVIDDGAKLHIIDPETGKLLTKKALGTRMDSTPLVADGKVYLCTYSGVWYVLKPKGDSVEVVQKQRLSGDENLGSPIVSHGRIYLPTTKALYAIGMKAAVDKGKKPPKDDAAGKAKEEEKGGAGDRGKDGPADEPSAAPAPAGLPGETPIEQDPQVAQVQISPYDVLLRPDGKRQFRVRLYNSRGQLLRVAKPEEATFRVEGPGEITPSGAYTASKTDGHVGALVYGKVGELEGKARVRIVPPLPWRFDFNSGEEMPITWIGGRIRYVPAEVDGEKAALKLDVLPTPANPNNKLGTRSPLYMGSRRMTNYTIQADVRLTEKNGRLPEVIGLINSGYTLGIRSGEKVASIYSWASHDYRQQASVDFEPAPDVWYRLRLRVQQQGGKAEVKGKLWIRDQAEPEGWTLEMVDEAPNKSGSPGLYGNTQMAPFYVDNLSVTKNERPAPAADGKAP